KPASRPRNRNRGCAAAAAHDVAAVPPPPPPASPFTPILPQTCAARPGKTGGEPFPDSPARGPSHLPLPFPGRGTFWRIVEFGCRFSVPVLTHRPVRALRSRIAVCFSFAISLTSLHGVQ